MKRPAQEISQYELDLMMVKHAQNLSEDEETKKEIDKAMPKKEFRLNTA